MHVSIIEDPLRGLGGSNAESRPERASGTGLWPCQARRQDRFRANRSVGFEAVMGRARWVGFIWVLRFFFRGFLVSAAAAASSSLILLSLLRVVDSSLLHAISSVGLCFV